MVDADADTTCSCGGGGGAVTDIATAKLELLLLLIDGAFPTKAKASEPSYWAANNNNINISGSAAIRDEELILILSCCFDSPQCLLLFHKQ